MDDEWREEAITMVRATVRGMAVEQTFWPSRAELNRAAAPPGPAHRLLVRVGTALAEWGRRPRSGAARDPYLRAHEERMAVIAATRHAGLPFP